MLRNIGCVFVFCAIPAILGTSVFGNCLLLQETNQSFATKNESLQQQSLRLLALVVKAGGNNDPAIDQSLVYEILASKPKPDMKFERELSTFVSVARSQLKLSDVDLRLIVDAHQNFLAGLNDLNISDLEKAYLQYSKVLGESSLMTKIGLVQLERIRESDSLLEDRLPDLVREFDAALAENSLYRADANQLYARRLTHMQNFRLAIPLLDKCQPVFKAAESFDLSRSTGMHLDYASSYCHAREFAKASRSLELAEKLTQADPSPAKSISLHSRYALYHFGMADARMAYDRLNLGAEVIKGNPSLIAAKPGPVYEIYAGLATTCARLGLHEQAVEYADKMLQHQLEHSFLPISDAEAIAYKHYLCALAYRVAEKFNSAEVEIDKSLVIIRKENSTLAQLAIFEAAEIYNRQEKFQKVIDVLNDSTTWVKKRSQNYASLINLNLANAQLGLGQTAKALELGELAHQDALEDCKNNIYRFNVPSSLEISSKLAKIRNTIVEACLKDGSAEKARQCFSVVCKSKGLTDSILEQRNRLLTISKSQGAKNAGDEFRLANATLERAIRDKRDAAEIRLLQKEKAEKFKNMVSFLPANLTGSFQNQSKTISELGKVLPAGITVIDFVKYRQVKGAKFRYAAFLITKSADRRNELVIELKDIGDSDPIDDLISSRSRLLVPRQNGRLASRGIEEDEDDEEIPTGPLQQNDSKLDALLWSKLQGSVKQAKTLVICPSGKLAALNWSSFKNPSTGKFLAEEFQIVAADNSSSVLRFLQKKIPKPKSGCLVVGHPDFGQAESGSPRFQKLDDSRAEAQSVFEVFNSEGRLLLGRDATKENFKKNILKFGVFHIASHGIRSFSKGDDTQLKRNPLGDYSVVFANANVQDNQQALLSSDEFWEFDLSHIQLAVLSTCDSAQGLVSSEGVFGIEKALRIAGTQATLTSQTSLDDRNAKEFVKCFYDNWKNNGLSKAESFQLAQQRMIKEKIPVQYWSSWHLVGDWR